MIEFLAALGGLWWLAPTAIALGAVGVTFVHRRRLRDPRRLGYRASQVDVIEARRSAARRRAELKVARAEHHRLVTERSVKREPGVNLGASRKLVRDAERSVRAADAATRAAYARRSAARQELPLLKTPEQYPLAQITARHDAVLRRWLDYETDPAMVIAYPQMSDGSVPATGDFLAASQRAGWLRPAKDTAVTPEEFSRYRDAVHALEAAFEAAERAVRGRESGPAAAGWQDTAQHVLWRSAEALERATDVAASVIAAWGRRGRPEQEDPR